MKIVAVNNQCEFHFLVRPVETRLIASELGAMTADVEYEVCCETAGAQPAAVISWWINGNIRLKDFVNEVREREVYTRLGPILKDFATSQSQ